MKTIRIGRNSDNDIVLEDQTVSGHHAVITFDGQCYVIEDVGSKNGTYVNGNRISASRCTGSKQLDKYDVVKIGFQTLPWLNYFENNTSTAYAPSTVEYTSTGSNTPTTESKVTQKPTPEGSNGMAIAGFVLSFFVPLLGIIFSIIGKNKSESLNGKGHDLAVAGIIISIISFVLNFIIIANS